MHSFEAYDVNQALMKGLHLLLRHGVEETSRAGNVLVAPGPVCTEYLNPRCRVLLSPTRDANPFFHFMESLWMLSGQYEHKFPMYFNSSYGQFSDDGVGMWDGYGWRWRQFFGCDQLQPIIDELSSNSESRRCVLSMWDGGQTGALRTNVWDERHPEGGDFYVATHGGKAVPCNTHAYLDRRDGQLNITVCNRSNDAVWGCYGANAVHFSFLQEYIAAHVGIPVGIYRQFSNNFHIYIDKFSREWMHKVANESWLESCTAEPGPMIDADTFDEDLKKFMEWAAFAIDGDMSVILPDCSGALFRHVAIPMFEAWHAHKHKDQSDARYCVGLIEAPDWQRACTDWLVRRYGKIPQTEEVRAQ